MSGVDFEQVMQAALAADAGVAGIVSRRIFPLSAPKGAPLPFITYQRVSGAPEAVLDGDAPCERISIQIDAWAKTYGEAKRLAKAVRGVMAGAEFAAELDEDRDLSDEEARVCRVSMDFIVWA
ncbi:DUF3168 domain-containing protein [Desulfovibrio oxamicus]|uniref:DUF3168 domain-containing protein n=1 Tax=Nitratidesulfovibrio oxamicus TaxID=32016 RepID=A0ABS0J124_9BACT|nr:DUF3168 domain-containing protein [Nitratidesulfovibrio oxamicus]MBG3876135.1 DUF3168 domain-containing protein [Nitratidesulfovibrio oxamicus]